MEDDPQSSDISNSGEQEVSILKWKVYEGQIRVWNEAMRTSWLGLLIDPKSDSSVSKVVHCYNKWEDTQLLEMKIEATCGTKDDPVSSPIPDVLTMNPIPRLPTKVSFKGGSPPSISNPSFFLASPNLGDEISFKGGSLSHPKILECENKKNRNHVCLYWLKFHRELKLFELFKSIIRKTISNSLLFPKELLLRISFQFAFTQPMQALLQRKYFTKWFISNKPCYAKSMFENKYQILFL
jgi:hypothetical protein